MNKKDLIESILLTLISSTLEMDFFPLRQGWWWWWQPGPSECTFQNTTIMQNADKAKRSA